MTYRSAITFSPKSLFKLYFQSVCGYDLAVCMDDSQLESPGFDAPNFFMEFYGVSTIRSCSSKENNIFMKQSLHSKPKKKLQSLKRRCLDVKEKTSKRTRYLENKRSLIDLDSISRLCSLLLYSIIWISFPMQTHYARK